LKNINPLYPPWAIKENLNKEGVPGKKMVGDTGFEPVTSTVCKRHKKKRNRKI
jgi:hypothetical protein